MNYSILKPEKNTVWLGNGTGQKVSYLNIDDTITEESLKRDIKNGAVFLKDIPKLLKEKELPRYTVVHAQSEELGLMTISYLAALYNRRDNAAAKVKYSRDGSDDGSEILPQTGKEPVTPCYGEIKDNEDEAMEEEMFEAPDFSDFRDPTDSGSGVNPNNMFDSQNDTYWQEDPWRLPIIQYSAIVNYNSFASSLSQNNLMMNGMNSGPVVIPFWTHLTEEPLIIRKDSQTPGMYGFGYDPSFENMEADTTTEELEKTLGRFKGNRHVFILYVEKLTYAERMSFSDDDEENETRLMSPYAEKEISTMMLQYLAEVATAHLTDRELERFREKLLSDWAQKLDHPLETGFPTKKIVKRISSIYLMGGNVSALIEKVVRYVIKKNRLEGNLKEADFDSITRFANRELAANRTISKDPMKLMDRELVGMEEIKGDIMKMVNVQRYNQLRMKHKLPVSSYHNVHLLLGAPGTAKTTVAKLTGDIMAKEGLIGGSNFISVNGAELKGMFVGHTAPKVHALFEQYDIILIDEAYSIVSEDGHDDSFSNEALAQLMIELEDHATDKLVFFAGYGGKDVNDKNNKMKRFLDANPGLRSRINTTIYFKSYDPDMMTSIFSNLAKRNRFRVDASVMGEVKEHFARRQEDVNFGNGREARALLENSMANAANRIMGRDKRKVSKNSLQLIKKEDVREAIRSAEEGYNMQVGCRDKKLGFH